MPEKNNPRKFDHRNVVPWEYRAENYYGEAAADIRMDDMATILRRILTEGTGSGVFTNGPETNPTVVSKTEIKVQEKTQPTHENHSGDGSRWDEI